MYRYSRPFFSLYYSLTLSDFFVSFQLLHERSIGIIGGLPRSRPIGLCPLLPPDAFPPDFIIEAHPSLDSIKKAKDL